MKDTISEALGLSPLQEEILLKIEEDINYELKHNSVNVWGGGKGELNNFYGKKHTKETKELMSLVAKGKSKIMPPGFGAGEKNSFYGKTHSEEFKKELSARSKNNTYRLGKTHTKETKNKISKSTTLRFQDENERKRISETLTGRKASQETKDKMSKAQTGRIISEEHRLKISESNKNCKKYICIHCGISCQLGAHNRWHGDNCKKKK